MEVAWFSGLASADLGRPTEIGLQVKGTALEGKVDVLHGPFRLVADTNFKEGDLILAELAIASAPTSAVQGEHDFASACHLSGPFASLPGGGAAIRFASSLPALKAGLDSGKLSTRSDILRAALTLHGIPAVVSSASSSNKESSKKAPEETEVRLPRQREQFLFVRASAVRHSCAPSAVAVIYRDSAAGGVPALHLLARRKIAKGEEITLSLLPDATHSREMRHRALAGRTSTLASAPAASAVSGCDCDRCSCPYDDTEALRCRACDGPARVTWAGTSSGESEGSGSAGRGAAAAAAAGRAFAATSERSAASAATAADAIGEPTVRCEACGAVEAEPLDALRRRVAALAAVDAALAALTGSGRGAGAAADQEEALHTALAAYSVVHPCDTHLLRRAHTLLHRVVDGRAVMAAAARSPAPAPAPAAAAAAGAGPGPGPGPADGAADKGKDEGSARASEGKGDGGVATAVAATAEMKPSESESVSATSPAAPSPSPSPWPSAVPASAVELSEALVSAASSLPFLDPFLLREILIDHGLLCGMAGCGERGREAWRRAASLTRTFNPIGSPMHELFDSFAAKPPRNAREAAAAFRMRAVAEQTLGI